jgi:hypothetical protein
VAKDLIYGEKKIKGIEPGCGHWPVAFEDEFYLSMTAFDYFSLFFGPIKLLTCFGFP